MKIHTLPGRWNAGEVHSMSLDFYRVLGEEQGEVVNIHPLRRKHELVEHLDARGRGVPKGNLYQIVGSQILVELAVDVLSEQFISHATLSRDATLLREESPATAISLADALCSGEGEAGANVLCWLAQNTSGDVTFLVVFAGGTVGSIFVLEFARKMGSESATRFVEVIDSWIRRK